MMVHHLLIEALRLYQEHCDCAGPQPSIRGARADEHAADCPYRVRVENPTDSLERTDEKGSEADEK